MQATNKSDAAQVYEGATKSTRTGTKGTIKYILKPFMIFSYHYFIEGIKAVQKDGQTKELEKITNLLVEKLDVDAEKVTENATFSEDLGIDSLDLFDLVMSFEEEFGIEIPAEELEELKTVGDMVKYLNDKGVNA